MIKFHKSRFRFLVQRADAARDEKRFTAAAALYEEALRIRPHHVGVHIQAGHVLKESRKYDLAEAHYLEAERLAPDNADLALQMGHLYKLAGRPTKACKAYERALQLSPGWDDPARELATLKNAMLPLSVCAEDPEEFAVQFGGREDAFGGRTAAELERLVPALVAKPYEDLLFSHAEEVAIRRLGHRETTFWGNRQTLRGLEAVRGFCVSAKAIVEVQVFLNGVRLHRGPVKGGYVLRLERDKQRVKKYVFNYWIDFSGITHGLHEIEVRCFDVDDGIRTATETVVIAAPISEEAYPDSNFLVSLRPGDSGTIEEQVSARPSMVRQAKRALFPDGVGSVLVMRTDQLGDMVASVAALRRLREILPDAKIVGLFNYANGELARSLGLLDEIIVIDFPDDPIERRRLMSLDAQEALRRQLEPYQFDIALDLAQASVSRELLRLANAKFTYGTGGEDWPWLSSDFLFHTRDRWTRHDFTPHSTKVLALVESLGALLKTAAPIMRRPDLSPDNLAAYGIAPGERFAVLHTGARIGFSRWPHYAALAHMLLDASDLKIVVITEDPSFRSTMPEDLLSDPRLIFLDRRLPYDDFDAFLSFATVMAGNDSGPKHLASLRGTPAVTIFSARINWTEWGQENVGVIISRRLPCAGCALLHDAEECGRDFVCVTDIRAREVFDAMMVYVDGRGEALS